MIRDRAIASLVSKPARCRLPGMVRDLTTEDLRILAFYEAAVMTAIQKLGVDLTTEQPGALSSGLFTAEQQPIEGADVSYNSDK